MTLVVLILIFKSLLKRFSIWFDRGSNATHQMVCHECLRQPNEDYQSVKSKIFTIAHHERAGHIREGEDAFQK